MVTVEKKQIPGARTEAFKDVSVLALTRHSFESAVL
jgi:hypothetical protein